MVPLVILLTSLQASPPVPLEGNTFHVQGIAVDGRRLWLTATDRVRQQAWIFEYDIKTGRRQRERNITIGNRTHPGGISYGGEFLYVPVAENRNGGKSSILTLTAGGLETLASFEVDDHIGAVAVGPRRLHGVNWDARHFYMWSGNGSLMTKVANPSAGRYQDMKFRRNHMVVSGLEGQEGVIRWLDPETLRTVAEIKTGRTDRGTMFTNEGMDVVAGKLYLLPEDAPSRLFVFSLPAGFPQQ